MTKRWQDLRIVFMGTPEFAVASLDALVQAGGNITGVVTAPDKPAGRGLQIQESAIKKYALAKGLPILQPEKLKNPEFIQALTALQADLQVVVAFRMLPEVVWDMPPLGTINVHASLLPKYRGAAPINWAVINGETETGVTTFKLQHQIDTGNILLSDTVPIGPDSTAGQIHDLLKEKGAEVLLRTVEQLGEGVLQGKPQPDPEPGATDSLPHAPKIQTETGRIDWNQPIERIYNLIRGLSPYPAAFTQLDGKGLKIYSAQKEALVHPEPTEPTGPVNPAKMPLPGTFETDGKTYLRFAGADGFIKVTDLQLEGKKRMSVGDFLRGYRPPNQP
jgi:methionyl-tRNA formyltransferase